MDTEKTQKKDSRGGRREGAGRKPTFARQMQFKAPKEMADYLDQFENKSEYIKQCIENDMMQRKKGMMAVMKGIGKVGKAKDDEVLIPYYENVRVAAGVPIGGADTTMEAIDLAKMMRIGADSYIVEVKGTSMIDAGINSGDMVVIDPVPGDYGAKDILLCEVDGEYTIKHVRKEGEKVMLVPENKDFPEMEVEPESLRVWGKVTSVIRRFS